MKKRNRDIQLVVTIALKKEVPKDWLASRHVPVHTLPALKSGALLQTRQSDRGILVVITGAGPGASEDAARWVADNLSPLYVLNIGTCGVPDRKHPLRSWFMPRFVTQGDGKVLDLDSRLPVPPPEKIIPADSLLSAGKPVRDNIAPGREHHDLIDMECYRQATIFSETPVSFHCLKFGTDRADTGTSSDFSRNLPLFREKLKTLFSFLDLPPPDRPLERKGPTDNPAAVTVIVPVYNREKTISRAIESLLAQTCRPESIIVVDDCSTDRTGEILRSYGEKITLLRLPGNSGPSRARNEGIRHASTEWLAFMDSDDVWEKRKLKCQADFLTRYPFYQILQSGEKWIRNNVRVNPCRHHEKPEGWIFEPSLERCLISPSGVLLRKSLIEHFGCFNEDLPVCEDYDLWIRISRHHPVGLDRSLSVVKYGGHKDQLSRAYPAMDRFRVMSLAALLNNERNPLFREIIIPVLRKKLRILIRGCEKRGNTEEARKWIKRLRSVPESGMEG